MKIAKTNAMRRLDAAKIPYTVMEYTVDENDLSATHIADEIGLAYGQVFKTLVAKGDKTGHIVLCIPADGEIDLKAVAALTGNKKIEMVHVKDLLALTGYIRGGVSPIGMKKKFPTYIDRSCLDWEQITVSSGQRGAQLLLECAALVKFTESTVAALTVCRQ